MSSYNMFSIIYQNTFFEYYDQGRYIIQAFIYKSIKRYFKGRNFREWKNREIFGNNFREWPLS